MIKKGITAVLLALFLFAISLAGLFYTSASMDTMETLLTQALEASYHKDSEKAAFFSQKAVDSWTNQHKILCTYMSHSKLETIDQSLATLSPLASYETWDQFTAECHRCLTMIHYLKDGETPTLDNIF